MIFYICISNCTGGLKNVIFHDEIPKVQQEVTRLINEEGVNKIIVVGHAGYSLDKDLAAAVEGVDVVVGGHTDTFLYTGELNYLVFGTFFNFQFSKKAPTAWIQDVLATKEHTCPTEIFIGGVEGEGLGQSTISQPSCFTKCAF